MALIHSLKRAFGFSDDEEEYNDDVVDNDTPNPFAPEPAVTSDDAMPSDVSTAETPSDGSVPPELPMSLFDGVIAVFNQSLPDFIRQCVDVEAQRRYLYNMLDSSLKEYLQQVSAETGRRASRRWDDERARMESELTRLRDEHKTMEASRGEWRQQQLSLDRQKRALSDRVHDLENQVTALESEKEQYQLETKSLVNKIKAASVRDDDAMAGKIEELEARIVKKDTLIKTLNQTITELQARNDNAETDETRFERISQSLAAATETLRQKEEEIADLNKKVTAMNAENTKLSMSYGQLHDEMSANEDVHRQQIDELKVKIMVSDRMISELNASASSATEALSQKDELIETLQQEKKVAADSLEVLNEKYGLLNGELQSTREELDQAREELQVVAEIQEQLDRFEEVKNKKDARISSLQTEIVALKEKIDSLEADKLSLKHTIERNLMGQATSENDLRSEIDRLKADLEARRAADAPVLADLPEAAPPVKKRRKAKISAIDPTIDNTDWLLSTPPDDKSVKSSQVSDADFGYQEPARKSHPDSDAQMSLW
ncbi:MAG: hypothetical protein NC117_04740 [Pseudoflavonifractor sp.]|nr:hypothetical protein [Pseudoflavonifractor sp.]